MTFNVETLVERNRYVSNLSYPTLCYHRANHDEGNLLLITSPSQPSLKSLQLVGLYPNF